MKKITLFLFSIIFMLTKVIFATQISVSGNISTNTTWNADTVLVTGDVTVLPNITLTVLPGTYIEFQGHYQLGVNGKLMAVGAVNDSIVFTINNSNGHDQLSNSSGGWAGIRFTNNSNPNDTSWISYCVVKYGKAVKDSIHTSNDYYAGGAIYKSSSNMLVISNSAFSNNISTWDGGAIYNAFNKIIIKNNLIYKNNAGDGGFGTSGNGGAIGLSFDGGSLISGNIVSNNYAGDGGGAMGLRDGSPYIVNNIIVNNKADAAGGGIFCWPFSASEKISNNIICNNVGQQGGGIATNSSNAKIQNNILWGNQQTYLGTTLNQVCVQNSGAPTFYNNDIQGGLAGFTYSSHAVITDYYNSIDTLPGFVNPSAGAGNTYDGLLADWSLPFCSPCYNKGSADTSGTNVGAFDYWKNKRIYADTIDIGAQEINSLSQQPVNAMVCENANVTFGLIPVDTSYTFQWQMSTNNGVSWINVINDSTYSGATSTLLSIDTAITSMNNYLYRCLVNNCHPFDASDNAKLIVNAKPVITYVQSPDTVCLNSSTLALSASPLGGSFSGTGVTNNMFDASSAGIGSHTITYSYTDSNTCANSATQNIYVDLCTGVDANANNILSKVDVFPNPFSGSISLVGIKGVVDVSIYNILGEKVSCWIVNNNTFIETEKIPPGTYFVVLKTNNDTIRKKMIKE